MILTSRRTATRRRFSLFLAVVVVLVQTIGLLPGSGQTPAAHASTVNVTNTADSGPGTLRDAIASATAGDTINITVPGQITLTTGELAINVGLTINGLGVGTTIMDGNSASRVFHIGAGSFSVSITGMTIQHGTGVPGGGVLNDGATLTLNGTEV